jgi:mono/diheme cytochrome c family protein
MKVKQWMYALSLMGLVACGDDDPNEPQPPNDGGRDASVDSGPSAPVDAGLDATVSLDATVVDASSDAAADAGPTLAQKVERGRYLVENVGACGDCHTPRVEGTPAFDVAKTLAGVDCFVDADPNDPNVGCISSRNLTNHETGLKNRSDQEIKDLFLKGLRPDGTALHPIMPYYVLANMTGADADAIVAFLRTVPAVDHMVAATQAPFAGTAAPAPTWPDALIPQPEASYAFQAEAKRGRYLAGQFGVCMECHTPQGEQGPDPTRAFQGGRPFRALEELGLPTPPFPASIYSSNLTPHASGIEGYDVAKLVKAIKQGADKDNKPLCPPMPAGPMAPFAGITDADATDIAHYLLSLAPKENVLPNGCDLPTGP